MDETVLDERLHSMWMKVFLTLVVFSPPLFCVLHPSGAQHIDCFTCRFTKNCQPSFFLLTNPGDTVSFTRLLPPNSARSHSVDTPSFP